MASFNEERVADWMAGLLANWTDCQGTVSTPGTLEQIPGTFVSVPYCPCRLLVRKEEEKIIKEGFGSIFYYLFVQHPPFPSLKGTIKRIIIT